MHSRLLHPQVTSLCQVEDNQRQQACNPNQEFFLYSPKGDREVPVDFVTGCNIPQRSQKKTKKLCSKGFHAAGIQGPLDAL